MNKVINVLSHKGGCGKSETVLNLAYGLSKKGKTVLVIDCDPQCNSTSILLADKPLKESESDLFLKMYRELSGEEKGDFNSAIKALKQYVMQSKVDFDIHDVLENNCLPQEAVCQTRYEGIEIIPSGTNLSLTDFQLKNKSLNPYQALRMALNRLDKNYDFIIIDNQPFKNALTFNTIASCTKENDLVIIPTKINRGGLEGTYETIETIMEWLSMERLPLDIKMLITMTNRNKIDVSWEKALKEAFGDLIFNTSIRYQAKPVEDASMKKKILLELAAQGVAEDYQNLVDEVFALQ